MPNRRVGGILFIKVDGQLYQTGEGDWTYNINPVKRESVMSQSEVAGFSEQPKPVFIEGEFTDNDELDLSILQSLRDATITAELANGKVIVFREAFYAADGDVTTQKGQIQVRFEAVSAEEIAA